MNIKKKIRDEVIFWGIWVPVCLIGFTALMVYISRSKPVEGGINGR